MRPIRGFFMSRPICALLSLNFVTWVKLVVRRYSEFSEYREFNEFKESAIITHLHLIIPKFHNPLISPNLTTLTTHYSLLTTHYSLLITHLIVSPIKRKRPHNTFSSNFPLFLAWWVWGDVVGMLLSFMILALHLVGEKGGFVPKICLFVTNCRVLCYYINIIFYFCTFHVCVHAWS